MRRALIALTSLLLLAAIGLLVLGLRPYLQRASHVTAPPESREAVCVGGPNLDAKQHVQFFHPTAKVPEATWSAPVVEQVALPEPQRALGMAASLGEGPPIDDCVMLFEVFEMYRRGFKENPVGNQQQIVQALCGANPKGIAYLDRKQATKDWNVLDRWGTPFFFHQLSGTVTEVVSAGPDKQFGTEDDMQVPDPEPLFE